MPDLPVRSNSAPDIEEIETILRSFKASPDEQFYQVVVQSAWYRRPGAVGNERQPAFLSRRRGYGLAFALLAVILLAGLILVTPVGESFAETISRFFKLSPSAHATETVSLTPMPTNDPGYPYNQYSLTVAQAEKLAGFKVKIPATLPEGLLFNGVKYESDLQKVSLFYSGSKEGNNRRSNIYLYVVEQKGAFENFNWGLCPNGTLRQVEINGWPAELAGGAVWVTTTEPTPGVEREWICQAVDPGAAMDLRWQEDSIRYDINIAQFVSEGEHPQLTEEDLIEMAESLK
jgi:hypothetical protein